MTDLELAARAAVAAWEKFRRPMASSAARERDRARLEAAMRHLDDVVGYSRSLNVRHNRRLEEPGRRRQPLREDARLDYYGPGGYHPFEPHK